MRFAWVRPAPPVGQVALALKVDGLSPFRWSYSPDDETLAGQVLRLEPDSWGETASDGGIRLDEIADEMLTNPDVDLVTFTGGVAVGKSIAAKAVYKRQVLELGGNDPLIVMEDADLDEAATLAANGSYKNSGQRCTAVKRMLVHEKVADAFVERLVALTRAWTYGDPMDPENDMGTVIDEAAAKMDRILKD